MAIDDSPAASGMVHRCPACGAPVERVHRHAFDRALSVLRSMHRYRCVAAACGWEGLLRRFSTDTVPDRSAQWRSRLLWLMLGATVALAGTQGLRWILSRQHSAHPTQFRSGGAAELQSRATPAGQDFAGEAVPAEDDRAEGNHTPLTLRNSCAWGVPGANRYRGSVDQALRAAQLPGEVIRQLTERVGHGWMHEQVEISRNGIRTLDGRIDYGNQMLAMAFGSSLCFNTRVNFVPGHVEYAALYRAADTQGRTYTIIVPYVCDNVAVLGERVEIETNGHRTPEPATLGTVLLGLGVAGWLTHRTVRRRGA